MISFSKNEYAPDFATPPGEILQETLESRGMKKKDFAERCGLSPKHVSRIISGKAAVTPDTAIRFELVLGIADGVWNNLEANFRAFHARRKAAGELDKKVEWVKRFPIRDLVKRCLIEKPRDSVHSLRLLLGFFGVASIQVWEERYGSWITACAGSPVLPSQLESLASWLRFGELLAQNIEVEPFDRESFVGALVEMRSLTNQSPKDCIPKIADLCRRSGVAFVSVPEFPGTRVTGAAHWVASEKAVIQLSMRHRTNDHFWFSFFREASHILCHSKKRLCVDQDNQFTSNEEKAADDLAARMLIPPGRYKAFIANKRFTRKSVSTFAKAVGIAPGLVVGKLQRDKLIEEKRLDDLKVTFWRRERDSNPRYH